MVGHSVNWVMAEHCCIESPNTGEAIWVLSPEGHFDSGQCFISGCVWTANLVCLSVSTEKVLNIFFPVSVEINLYPIWCPALTSLLKQKVHWGLCSSWMQLKSICLHANFQMRAKLCVIPSHAFVPWHFAFNEKQTQLAANLRGRRISGEVLLRLFFLPFVHKPWVPAAFFICVGKDTGSMKDKKLVFGGGGAMHLHKEFDPESFIDNCDIHVVLKLVQIPCNVSFMMEW